MAVDDVIDKLQSKSIFKEQTIQKIQSRPSKEAKAMELLELFETANRSRFNALVESLSEAKQGLLVHYLQETLTDLKKSEIGSDFEDMKSSKLQLVSSNDSKEWKLMKFRPKSNLPNHATVIIPSNQRNFNLIGIEVPYDYPEDEICRVANEIYEMMYQIPVRLIVKQHAQRPSDLYIRCVEKSKSQDALREMASLGYKDGPLEMAELGLRDTEEVIFNASGDIKFLSGTTRMSFFLNVESAHLSFQIIDVVNKEAQTLGRTYQGNLAYNVGDTPQPPPRSGSFLIRLPKEAQRYAPLMLDVSVKAAAKYLAWQLTKRGSPDPHDLYMKLCGGYGKKTVLKSLANIEGRPLSDNSIKEFSLKLDQKWEILARKLGFDDKYIEALNMDFDNTRAVHLLDKWRLLDTTIELGTDITATLVKAMDSV
uniref:Death domain-containing protein n=1 Tax=Magallana gigas TaxID=29159 RepID=A0A8W8JWJ8_MAGGI